MNTPDDTELLRLLVKGARQEGREEAAANDSGARVAELDEQLQTERYWHATWQEESQKLKECLERVQGERDALAAQLAESDRGHTEACDALAKCRQNWDSACVQRDRLEAEVDRLRRHDGERARLAELGALVEAMPNGYDLCRGEKEWYVNTVGGCVGLDYATPTEALRAAGVVAVDPDGATEREEGVRS